MGLPASGEVVLLYGFNAITANKKHIYIYIIVRRYLLHIFIYKNNFATSEYQVDACTVLIKHTHTVLYIWIPTCTVTARLHIMLQANNVHFAQLIKSVM